MSDQIKGCKYGLGYTAFFFSLRVKGVFALYGNYLFIVCEGLGLYL